MLWLADIKRAAEAEVHTGPAADSDAIDASQEDERPPPLMTDLDDMVDPAAWLLPMQWSEPSQTHKDQHNEELFDICTPRDVMAHNLPCPFLETPESQECCWPRFRQPAAHSMLSIAWGPKQDPSVQRNRLDSSYSSYLSSMASQAAPTSSPRPSPRQSLLSQG